MVESELFHMVVGVLQGGVSSEREISFLSGEQVISSLQRYYIDVVPVEINTRDEQILKEVIEKSNIDVAFIALHGEFGEDGGIQRILEKMNVPYTGSGPDASYNAMDKSISKKLFLRESVPTPRHCILTENQPLPAEFYCPLVVKPHLSGSSIGVTIVKEERILNEALKEAFSFSDKVLLETYIEGKELTVGILDGIPLGVVEIVPKTSYYDFSAKYTDGLVEFIAPARLPPDLYRSVQEIALKAHNSLGCRDFSRVDIRLSSDGVPYVLEVNSIPGLTSHSLLPVSARCCGIHFDALIQRMIVLALKNIQMSKTRM